MKTFDTNFLNELTAKAKKNHRKRQHSNIHDSYEDPCQCLFNAIEPPSYIRPHRHFADPKDELLVAIKGLMALVRFNDQGKVLQIIRFGLNSQINNLVVAVQVPVGTWHTVVALETDCILLEIKEGPFDPNKSKDPAPWAPEENSVAAPNYLNQLIESASR